MEVENICKYCHSDKIVKNGTHRCKQRYKCNSCEKVFVWWKTKRLSIYDKMSILDKLINENKSVKEIARDYQSYTATWIRKFIKSTKDKFRDFKQLKQWVKINNKKLSIYVIQEDNYDMWTKTYYSLFNYWFSWDNIYDYCQMPSYTFFICSMPVIERKDIIRYEQTNPVIELYTTNESRKLWREKNKDTLN